MNIKIVKVGYLQTNCYILENDKECLIIDPGDEPSKIIDNISKKVVGILITHYHFDHIGALEELKINYNCNVYDRNNLKEGINKISSFTLETIYTPGHKDDNISFLFDNNLFCGDFIFEGTIGRTDLPTGSLKEMKSSINKILKYDSNIIIYPGHGNKTTLKKEINNLNKYI